MLLLLLPPPPLPPPPPLAPPPPPFRAVDGAPLRAVEGADAKALPLRLLLLLLLLRLALGALVGDVFGGVVADLGVTASTLAVILQGTRSGGWSCRWSWNSWYAWWGEISTGGGLGSVMRTCGERVERRGEHLHARLDHRSLLGLCQAYLGRPRILARHRAARG